MEVTTIPLPRYLVMGFANEVQSVRQEFAGGRIDLFTQAFCDAQRAR